MIPIVAIVVTILYVFFVIWVTVKLPWLVLIMIGFLYYLCRTAPYDTEVWPNRNPLREI